MESETITADQPVKSMPFNDLRSSNRIYIFQDRIFALREISRLLNSYTDVENKYGRMLPSAYFQLMVGCFGLVTIKPLVKDHLTVG